MILHAVLLTAVLGLTILFLAFSPRTGRLVPVFPLLVLLAVVVRLVVGAANLSYGPFPGAETDAVTFEEFGARLADAWGQGRFRLFNWSFNFVNVVAVLYLVAGRVPLLITLLNALLVVLTMVNVVAILRALEIPQRRFWLPLAFIAVYPAGVLYSAVPLREAIIVLGLSIYLRGLLEAPVGAEWRRVRTWVGILLTFIFHTGMIVLVPLTFLMPVLRAAAVRDQLRARRTWPRIAGALVLLVACVMLANNYLYLARIPKVSRVFAAQGGFQAEALQLVQAGKVRGEGSYELHFPNTGMPVADAVLVMPEAAGRLLFSPLPWEAGFSFGELFKLLDVLIQLVLVVLLVATLRQRSSPSELRVPLAVVVVLALVFGFGTGNDGVAIRHRAKFTWAMAVVAAGAGAFHRPRTDPRASWTVQPRPVVAAP